MGWLRDTFGRLSGGAPAAQSGDAALHLGRGSELLEQGQFEAAVDSLERALALAKPGDDAVAPDRLHYMLGRAYAALGRLAPASMQFEAAVRARPDFPEALEEGARVLQELEEHEQAADWLQRLVQLRPKNAARLPLAAELRRGGRHDEAADLLRHLCIDEPRNIDAKVQYYHVLVTLCRFEEALAQINLVIAMCKPDPGFLVNRAVALTGLGRYREAMASLDKALKLDPAHPAALVNRIPVLMEQLRVREAVAAAEYGLRLLPQEAELHWRLASALLMLGDWPRGWTEAEWRTGSQRYERAFPEIEQPRWEGEDLSGRIIFLYPEQGFGDAIQFLRFVPELARRARIVLLLVWPELEALVPGVLPANCRVVRRGEALPAFDVHCPLMSLPAVLGTTLTTLPAHVPYVQAPAATVKVWRQRLDAGRLNVGICWAGNPRHFDDRQRSIPLAAMRALAAERCRFFTLQPQKRAGDDEILAGWSEAVDAGAELRDFGDTAGLIEALDLVITVDTSVAHLAGALGKPVWILVPHWPDWRWMLERSDSPWYPTARLYRQAKKGDWTSVLDRVQADLTLLAQTRSG